MPTDAAAVLEADARGLLTERTGRVVVGLVGPPGVGKSTLAQRLVRHFSGDAGYLPMDGFHLSNAQLDRLGRRHRKGAPDTFDVDGYLAVLQRITRAYGTEEVYVPGFERTLDEPVAAGLVIPAGARLVITEGNYLAAELPGWKAVRAEVDWLIYLDGSPELRRRRLIERHVAGGRSTADAQQWMATVDEPNAELIATTAQRCDRVLRLDP